MREITASVTERGQVTIPAEVRRALGLKKRDKVVFALEDGTVVLKKPALTLDDVVMSIPALKKPMSWKEMQEIAHEQIALESERRAHGR
jgi:AbrB family looped-hinge helix DNA binding protein